MRLFSNKKKQLSKQQSKLTALLSGPNNNESNGGCDDTYASATVASAAAASSVALAAAPSAATNNANGNGGGGGITSNTSKATSTASEQSVGMDWDKIYVEIDNDANGTIGRVATSRDSSSSMGETYGSKSYTIMEDDDDDDTRRTDDRTEFTDRSRDQTTGTPCLSNLQSGTISRETGNTMGRNVTNMSSDDGDDEDDGTMMVPTNLDEEEDARELTADDFSITKDGKYLSNNHFANAQLMRWKHAAEEGPSFIQVLAFLAALASLTSTLYPLVTDDTYWTIPNGICAFHAAMLSILIIVFEVRAWGARNPMSLRARVRNLFVRYLNVLRLLWGRGFLYIFAGSMNITVFFVPYVYFTGLTLVGLGLLAILIGAHASFNLERLRLSLTDHSFLWSKFVESDVDKDNLIGISEFSNLVWSLGLELDDAYTYRAFSEIDQDADSKISFHEFKSWWIASQDGDETIITMDISKETPHNVSSRKVPNHINV